MNVRAAVEFLTARVTDRARSTRLRTILRWMNGSNAETIQDALQQAIESDDWASFAAKMQAVKPRELDRTATRAAVLALTELEWQTRQAGGAGSGNFGHAGRPGEVGGSSSDGAGGAGGSGMPEWKSSGGFENTGIVWKQPTDASGRPIPIKCKSVEEAVPLVLDGKVIEVETPEQAYTLINRLAEAAKAAKDAGQDAKEFDLCQVSVKGTNLFCSESLRTPEYPNGVPRLEMPQLGGKPVPGSEADKLPRNPWDPSEVDGGAHFVVFLQGIGVKTEQDVVPASHLRASQRELVGTKVAKMIADRSFDPARNPIFISNDGYVIDGHHRWAAVLGRDLEDGKLGDKMMNVVRVNAPVSEVLHLANAWSKKFGIQQVAGVTKQAARTGLHHG